MLQVSLTLPDDTLYKFTGAVGFTDPQVDPQTGTFAIRAIVPNPDRELLPGQYTRVRMPLEVRKNALLVPEEATQQHLDTLAQIARQFSQPDFCQRLRSAVSSDDLFSAALGQAA